jgi:hypothetical protein
VAFQDFIENLFVEHDDVFMRLFIHTLEGDTRKWLRDILITSINSWQALESTFMK